MDGNLLVSNGLKQVLTEEYRDVVFGEAGTAGEALAQVDRQPWDLVIVDIGIPGKDGFYVLQETLLRRPATRVLMLNIQANGRLRFRLQGCRPVRSGEGFPKGAAGQSAFR